MKVCLMCDLHLPTAQNAIQYDVLKWAIENARQAHSDCILYAGDVTCDGNEAVYDFFLSAMKETKIPFFYIPGNSDLRSDKSRESIYQKASRCKNQMKNITVFAINDADKGVCDEQFAELDEAEDNSIVFMHHPIIDHDSQTVDRLSLWREAHPETMLFYGHLHTASMDGSSVSLQAMDPDKAIGEHPCITYYDTDTRMLEQVYYPIEIPDDLDRYWGISCYAPLEQIQFAIDHHLNSLELRPNCVRVDWNELKAAVRRWREAGGENLSIHLPDVGWVDDALSVHSDYAKLLELVKDLQAERVTQHVPMVSVKDVDRDPKILVRIGEYLSEQFNSVSHELVIGIENMHMTARDEAGENRRFGYLPEECLAFMRILKPMCRHTVGINFDIGHARNNAPYSQTYPIGAWLATVGESVVGYHIHQVLHRNGKFENHMPITDVYGPLISFSSLFHCWSTERIRKAPFVFEMRPENAYKETLETFSSWKMKLQKE